MIKAEEIFNVKAEYNKWLKELTYDEKDLVLEMINEAFRQFNNPEVETVINKDKGNEFEQLARPMILYLCENYHPHVTVVITPTNAELLEGKMSTGQIMDYIRD